MTAKPMREDGAVDAHARAGLGEAGGPIGVSGEAGDGDDDRERAPPATVAAVTSTRPTASQLAAGHAEGGERRVVAGRPTSSRTATWPTMSSAVSARARANSARATACGRIARSTVAACSDWSATKTCLPVAG